MHERKSIMKGLRLVWRTNATSSNTVKVLLFCVHTRPAWGRTGAHRCAPTHSNTHMHSLTCVHTHSRFFSQWQTSYRWPTLYHIAPELGKMPKKAYHWLQTYCLHCHINLIQKLSKGPLRFISASAFVFYFWRERSYSYDFSHCTTQTFCSKHFSNCCRYPLITL